MKQRSIERQATGVDFDRTVRVDMERKFRVMIADDNTEVRLATADLMMEVPGLEVVSLTANVDDAVEAALLHRPDIAFIDAWLKGGGAEGAARRIADVSPDTRVVALASAKELELVSRLRALGAVGCYQKETLSAELPGILAMASRR
jgi:DNA-binding NarL/FixJ family response regulator